MGIGSSKRSKHWLVGNDGSIGRANPHFFAQARCWSIERALLSFLHGHVCSSSLLLRTHVVDTYPSSQQDSSQELWFSLWSSWKRFLFDFCGLFVFGTGKEGCAETIELGNWNWLPCCWLLAHLLGLRQSPDCVFLHSALGWSDHSRSESCIIVPNHDCVEGAAI